MRVLLPSHTFLPDSPFGVELYTYYLARELGERDFAPRLFFSKPGLDRVEEGAFEGIPYTRVPQLRRAGPRDLDARNPVAEMEFRGLLAEFRPEIVHFNHLMHLSLNLPRIAAASGAGTVMTLHDYWLFCPKVKLLDWWGNRCAGAPSWKCASCSRPRYSRLHWDTLRPLGGHARSLRSLGKEAVFQLVERPLAWARIREREREARAAVDAIDVFIAPSKHMRATALAWGVPASRIQHVPYPTEALAYTCPASRPPGPLRFGFLGGTTREKGLAVLLEAFRGLSDAELWIYGPFERSAFPDFADVVRQENVRICGPIDDEAKATALPRLDALVVPSIWHEIGPLVILEAFRAGVPVLASRLPAMTERVRHEVDGLLFGPGDPADLRRAVVRCRDTSGFLAGLRSRIASPPTMADYVAGSIVPLYERLRERHAPLGHRLR